MNTSRDASGTSTRWYVVHCKTDREIQACSALRESLGLTTYLPTVESAAGKRTRKQAFFPGYFFVKADPVQLSMSSVNSTPNVLSLLHVGGQPQPVPDEIVKVIRERIDSLEAGGGLHIHPFKVGDRVRLTNGPLQGLDAVFLGSVKPGERVKILLKFLGRFNEVKVPVKSLEPAPAPHEQRRGTRGHGRRIAGVYK